MERILIVDDSIVQSTALKQILGPEYQVELCRSGEEALSVAADLSPSLILLDVIMPGIDGFETLVRLKAQPATHSIPVILITSLTDVLNEEKGLKLGAVDYIVKPFKAGIVRARVHTHTQLYAYRRVFENLAMIDGLTGIPNRRYYEEQRRSEWLRAMENQRPLSIGLLDVDLFKQYNDRYGHPQGDEALIQVARALSKRLCRSGDFAARYGGEEFVFLLPDTPGQEGQRIAEWIRRELEALQIPHEESPNGVLTVSIGGTTVIPVHGQDYDPFFQIVDNLLYQAKRSGRNAVVWTDQCGAHTGNPPLEG